MSAFNPEMKVISRYDTHSVFSSLEDAFAYIKNNSPFSNGWDYNTAIKTPEGWVVTNKFDPRCVDKVSPVKAGYRKEI
jgi:hypothetical protein